MKRFVLLSSLLAALALIALAATAQACPVPEGGGPVVKNAGTPSGPSSNAGPSTVSSSSDSSGAEQTGTATTDGTSITVTGADGASVTCALPAGFDPTPFLAGQVEAQCDFVNGVLTLTEIKNEAPGVEAQPGDDGDVDNVDDGNVNNVDDGNVNNVDEGDDSGDNGQGEDGGGSSSGDHGGVTGGEDGGSGGGGGDD